MVDRNVSSIDDSNAGLRCIVVTPEATILETQAEFIALPLFDGELGIALDHSPMVGRLGYGELRIRSGEKTERYYVDGGFVQVDHNVVSVLTNRAIPVAELDRETASAQLKDSISKSASGLEELALRDRQISQARGQLRLASRS